MDYTSSHLLYFGVVFLSTVFAGLAQLFKQSQAGLIKPNRWFWSLSFLCLWFVMGFRYEVGVDYYNYRDIYLDIQRRGILTYYQRGGSLEPGYLSLIYLVEKIFHSFSALFACSSFIALCFFYKAFSYEINKISLALCVFVFSSTQYFYYFGIDRLFVAVSIVAFAYRFIFYGKHKTYWMLVVLATTFHFSAAFMVFLPFLFKSRICSTGGSLRMLEKCPGGISEEAPLKAAEIRRLEFRKVVIFCFFIILPVLFLILKKIIPALPDKYLSYEESENIAPILQSVLLKSPILLLFFVFSKKMFRNNANNRLYFFLIVCSVFIQLCTMIVPIGRLNWYMWIGLCFLFPSLVSSFSPRNIFGRISMILLLLAYCAFYSARAYFWEFAYDSRACVMLPYSNLFFDL